MEDRTDPAQQSEPDSDVGVTPEEGVSVIQLTQYCFSLYVAHAWQMLGYTPDPVSKQIRVDLEQAKMAIDCADYLAGQVRSHLEETIHQEYARQIRDLKINYLDKQKQTWGENKGV